MNFDIHELYLMSTCIVCILSIFGKKGLKRPKMLLSAASISIIARKRELDGHTFSTPSGSPFHALPPERLPPTEPPRHRGEKEEILSMGHYLKFYA